MPLGISVDAQPSKHAWGVALCISDVPLVSDFFPFGKVSKDYGVFRESSGASGRAAVLIGEDGKVLWSKMYEMGEQPDINEIKQVIKDLS